jgi:hypothetical protein
MYAALYYSVPSGSVGSGAGIIATQEEVRPDGSVTFLSAFHARADDEPETRSSRDPSRPTRRHPGTSRTGCHLLTRANDNNRPAPTSRSERALAAG